VDSNIFYLFLYNIIRYIDNCFLLLLRSQFRYIIDWHKVNIDIFMEYIDKWITQFVYKLIIISNVGLYLSLLLKSWSDEHCSFIGFCQWKCHIEISKVISFCPKSATKLLMWVNKNLETCRDHAFFKTRISKVDGR